ncbi:MAG: cysteine--tRNA ligase [Phycisphaerales bacterium]|nr:cysteine--tRNA ligase [Phycisphaerales bacterium]
MTLRVYNTLTGEKELFESVHPGEVGVYLCGPTVYKPAHIGHAVGPVIFDVIKSYLSFKGYKVTWVVNVTDVEDKLITEAEAQGRTVHDLARELEEKYINSLQALGIKAIDHMPRASEHIQEIIDHIQQLIDKDIAYAVDGDVYFDVTKDEDYGKLTNRKSEEQFSGTRDGLVQSAKRNPGDFALWKAAKSEEPDQVKYASPWGQGRPGWHIECSAMAMKYLGETFDIHGGGLDLKFPHHENEIAQAESATDCTFAKYWLHHGLTRFNTKKISKSDPEFEKIMASLQLTNLLSKYSPELLRFLILQSHYRSPIDFSEETLQSAKTGLNTFYRLLERLERTTGSDPYDIDSLVELQDAAVETAGKDFLEQVMTQRVRFLEVMDDDFNTAGAIGVLFEMAVSINRFLDETRLETRNDDRLRGLVEAAGGAFVFLGRLLGLFEARPITATMSDDSRSPKLVDLLVQVRKMAREAKQYAIGDHIRDELSKLGVTLEDRKDGTEWRIDS